MVKGFLNLSLSPTIWKSTLMDIHDATSYGHKPETGDTIVVEYASPNTNKPLHLGHMRTILLGWSMANILEAQGNKVIRTQIVNDRGVAICKSMLAWQRYANNATPESSKIKGDFFVGKYYVLFDRKFQEEYAVWQRSSTGQQHYAQNNKGKDTRELLLKWEDGESDTMSLWHQMNGWVYSGFDQTYDQLGIRFDKSYYESQTYLLGRSITEHGLEKGVFYKEDDDSIWIDLEDVKLDKKIVLRADGTTVYLTQDLGTARQRYEDFDMDAMVYVVGDEQDYHFKVLFESLKRLGESYADRLHHLSYGMIDLPTGKMKSREGTVVDADELIAEVKAEAATSTLERGILSDLTPMEIDDINTKIALGALKFFILKVQAKKRMTFNPKESVDLQGQTGPYIQNAYVRIQSIKRKNTDQNNDHTISEYTALNNLEIGLIRSLSQYPDVITSAADKYDPAEIANYAYRLAKDYHRFYHDCQILKAPEPGAKAFRLLLSDQVGYVLEDALGLLGIDVPKQM
ncbi:UNVERIFIED_CONTAM: hypothetical protein GTU68_015247 [Idotea baltica]|nr:hypothetical protein [Idotea baltica]